ncbi:MAG: DUF748 domain-containing protein, partial [Burkholderiales bacterium]|nr:DUF748 domain-containing protein [Burkholderiales bacterium]
MAIRDWRWRRILLGIAAAIGLYALLGFFAVPALVERIAPGKIGEALGGRPVTLQRVEFNPFTFRTKLHHLSIRERGEDKEFAGFGLLEAHLSPRSLRHFAPVLSQIMLTGPRVRIARDAQGRYNIDDLIEQWRQSPPDPDPNAPPPRFAVANISVDGGRFEFDDGVNQEQHEISAFDLRVPFISTLRVHQDIYVQPRLSASIDGTQFEAHGRSLPFSQTHESLIDVELEAIDLTRYLDYLPVPLPVEIRSALLATALQISFEQPPDADPKIAVKGSVDLSKIDLRQPGGAALASIESIAAESIEVTLPANQHRVGRVAIKAPVLSVQRTAAQERFLEPVLAAIEKQSEGAQSGAKPAAAKTSSGAAPAAAPAASAVPAPAASAGPALAPGSPATPGGAPAAGSAPAAVAASSATASSATAATPAANAATPATPAAATAAPGALQWQVDEIAVTDGRLDLLDERFDPKPLAVKAQALQATVRQLGSDAAKPAQFELSLQLADGERAQAAGTAVWQTGAVQAKARLDDLALQRWWWIVQPQLAFEAVGGTLGADATITLTPVADAAPALRIEAAAARLRDLSLRQRWDRRTLLALPTLDLGDVAVDPGRQAIAIGSLSTKGGRLLVRREADARMNLQRLMAEAGESAASAKPGRSQPAAGSERAAGKPAAPANSTAASASPPWTLTLAKLGIEGFGFDVEDHASGKDANLRIDSVALTASGLSTAAGAPPAKLDLRARVDKRGSMAVSGSAGLNPVSAVLRLNARNLAIVPAQPYFTEYVNAVVSQGLLSAEGDLKFALAADGTPSYSYKGRAAVADFAAQNKEGRRELLRWKSLDVGGIALDSAPQLRVEIGDVALADFYSRLVINAEGRFNLQDLIVDRDAPPPGERRVVRSPAQAAAGSAVASDADMLLGPRADNAAAPARGAQTIKDETPQPADAKPSPLTRIGRVTLTNGNIDFSDFFVKPNYSANLTGMNGGISQITREAPGDLELRGRIDNSGSVSIIGPINPLADSLYLDIKADASDIDLPRLSPYSGKYVGYGIEKGKLSAKVAYKVEDRQLTAENRIILDQLTFGDKVDSPDAIKLPVLFAVSLLKDRNGVIDVELPISGSLDDPQFSVAGLVLRIIGNLIVKAVTAPFALLASLGGGSGEELSFLAFPAGGDDLDDATREKLQTLARALNDRPGLKLDITGRADPQTDIAALRREAADRLVKAQKLKETAPTLAPTPGALEPVKIDPAEYPKYVELAWRQAGFPKAAQAGQGGQGGQSGQSGQNAQSGSPAPAGPAARGSSSAASRPATGAKTPSPQAMLDDLITTVTIREAALANLANRRAQAVKEWLTASGGIAGERLFLTAPKLDGKPPAASVAQAAGETAGTASAEAAPASGGSTDAGTAGTANA